MTKFEQPPNIKSKNAIKCPWCNFTDVISIYYLDAYINGIQHDDNDDLPLVCPSCMKSFIMRYDYISDEVKILMPDTENTSKAKVNRHRDLCIKLNEIYKKKNHDYGDSFHKTFEDEGFAMARIRLSDKLERFKTLTKLDWDDQKVQDESIEDTLMDLANYALMTVLEMQNGKNEK